MATRSVNGLLTSVDSLFTTQQERDEANLKKIYDIPLSEIDDFPDHPYKVNNDEDSGVDYQCYTAVNRGSPNERKKRGLSVENACESPFIPGWKLDMMAKHIFTNYIENVERTMELAYSMLEKHIADKKEAPDNTDVIKRKQEEIERLNKKRANLFEMREDGDIDREHFRTRKNELEEKIEKLTAEIEALLPKKVEQSNEDFGTTLKRLKKKLESLSNCDGPKIPDNIVEGFIEKIWVSKDEFRWYLRNPSHNGTEDNKRERMKIADFVIDLEQAKKYQYSFSTKKRVYNWVDLNVSVWI